MTRFLLVLLFVTASLPAQQPASHQEPPEEDVGNGDKPKEYTFNPLQAAKELKIGNYYFKKGSFRAAAGRFQEATRWDPNEAEAWLRLGEANAKAGKLKEARDAWTKYLELKPDAKDADALRKRMHAKS